QPADLDHHVAGLAGSAGPSAPHQGLLQVGPPEALRVELGGPVDLGGHLRAGLGPRGDLLHGLAEARVEEVAVGEEPIDVPVAASEPVDVEPVMGAWVT